MQRVTLTEQEGYEFSFVIDIRVTDLNYGGHLGNAQMGGILHHANYSFLNALGVQKL